METIMLNTLGEVDSLVKQVHAVDEPVIVYDGADECLIAMRPAVFERILFDTDLLNCEQRASFSV